MGGIRVRLLDHTSPLAHRYLGTQLGDGYIEATGGAQARANNILVKLRPEHWLTVDYAKEFSTSAG